MDEPFGALDEMTRERLNAELLRIWEASGSTVVFVTHSIAEAVFLSTRVVVMSPRPGRVSRVIPIDLPQPRSQATREDPRFFELATELREALHIRGEGLRSPPPASRRVPRERPLRRSAGEAASRRSSRAACASGRRLSSCSSPSSAAGRPS